MEVIKASFWLAAAIDSVKAKYQSGTTVLRLSPKKIQKENSKRTVVRIHHGPPT
jgi:hypothetical protein